MDVLQYFIQLTYTDKHTTRSCPLATPEPLNQPQTSVKVRRSSGAPAGCHEAPSRQHRDLSGTHLLSQPICTAPPRRHTGCNRCTDKSNTSADKERGILVPSFSVRGALQLPAQDAGSLSAQTCWLRTWFRGVRCTVIPRAPCDRTGSRTGGLSSASFVIPPPRATENARRCRQGGGGANRAALRTVTPRARGGQSAEGTEGTASRGARGPSARPRCSGPPPAALSRSPAAPTTFGAPPAAPAAVSRAQAAIGGAKRRREGRKGTHRTPPSRPHPRSPARAQPGNLRRLLGPPRPAPPSAWAAPAATARGDGERDETGDKGSETAAGSSAGPRGSGRTAAVTRAPRRAD